jgi:hypothetical protein
MNTYPSHQSQSAAQELSWASQQAMAISAVDNIQPSAAGLDLMRSMDSGVISYEQAIQSIIDRAHRYASQV